MADIVVTPGKNGPYHIKGKVKIVTDGGREIFYEGDETWLCRCGLSAERPFCDGSHTKAGFKCDLDTE